MQSPLQETVINRLIADYDMRPQGDWLQHGKCPACHKKELFAHRENPWMIYCNRRNKCGWYSDIKLLYPDVFANLNQHYVATDNNPNATADAYLQYVRGFDVNRIKGWYCQGKFWHPKGDQGTATVRFYIDRQNDIYMERLIEPVTITEDSGEQVTRKANFHGSYKGQWWQPPDMQIHSGDTIWLVEGCLDAIALYLNGQKAVAILACNNYPDKSLALHASKKITWVWALDNDHAGESYLHKWVKRSRDAGLMTAAACIPTTCTYKQDWNDCHLAQRLDAKYRQNYLYHGNLLIAESALSKALLMWTKQPGNGFCVDFHNRLYWFELDLEQFNQAMEAADEQGSDESTLQEKMEAAKKAGVLTEIANCKPTFLYFQANALTDESWYYIKVVFPQSGIIRKNTFTGTQVATVAEFKKRLLSIAPGGLFTGNSKQLNWLIKQYTQNIQIVETIDFIGYSKIHKVYVFNEIAISNGHVYPINGEDYFSVEKLAIKSLNQGFQLCIGTQPEYQPDWVQWVYQAFGAKGLVVVSFWLGALFAEQIRTIHKSFPFLEIVGEPGAGKTTLIEFMWKLLGKVDEEGFDPSKATMAAISRKFAQVSNLPVVLIEADREQDLTKSRKFDWDELKTAYNGRASRARGIKNSGNETYEPPFRGAIVIAQNADVNASEAILQRIVHVQFDKTQHSDHSKIATDKMNMTDVNQLSYFLQQALINEAIIIDYLTKQTPVYEKQLLQCADIHSVRIAKNHAQVMALADGLSHLMKLTDVQRKEVHHCIQSLAIERQQAIVAEHPIVQQFWDIYDYLNASDKQPVLNHSRNNELIAINLNHFVKIANEHKQQIPSLLELKKHLKQSKCRPFQEVRSVCSAIMHSGCHYSTPKTVRCWIFQKEKQHG